MNLPNTLTVSRFFMAAAIMFLLAVDFPFSKSLALIIFIVAGITDYLDGYLARNVYGVTSFGRLMDPLADKVIVTAAFISFVGLRLGDNPRSLVPAWMVVIIISREFMVTGLRLLAAGKGKVISAGRWGKHKTVWQILAISFTLLGLSIRNDILMQSNPAALPNYDFAFYYITLGMTAAVVLITVVSGAMYFSEHRSMLRMMR